MEGSGLPTQPAGSSDPGPRKRIDRGVVAYFALGVVVVGAIGAILMARGDDPAVAPTTSTATTVTTTTAEPTTSRPEEEPPPTQMDTPDAEIRAAIEQHWQRRLQGSDAALRQAFAFFTGGLRETSGPEARWAAAVREDGLIDATVVRVPVTRRPDGSALATAVVQTNSRLGGCKRWVMEYDMVYQAAVWRARGLTASSSAC